MSTPSTNQQLILPAAADPDNVPTSFADYNTGVEQRLVQRFTSAADRTTRRGSPNEGELSFRGDADVYEWYTSGAAWVDLTLALRPPLAVASRSTSFPISSGGVGTVVEWTTELADTASLWAAGSPGTFTVPSGMGGIWHATCYIQFAANATGVRDVHILVASTSVVEDRRTAAASGNTSVTVASDVIATAGQTIQFRGLQTSGGSLNVVAGQASVRYVGRAT